MNLGRNRYANLITRCTGLALLSLLMVACAMTPASPQGAAEARNRLTELQNDPNLSGQARVEFREADAAVRLAEQPLPDNVGSAAHNNGLSQRRAESVRSYLTRQGIAARSLTASGIGMDRPVAGNDTASGRQQNQRVEIIIENPVEPVVQRRLQSLSTRKPGPSWPDIAVQVLTTNRNIFTRMAPAVQRQSVVQAILGSR